MVLVAKVKPRISRSHKKRVGKHHRHTKDYAKPYHPYIPIVIVIGLGLLANVFWGHASRGVLGAQTSLSSHELLTDTNAQRVDDGESSLTIDGQLAAAAQAKADDMAAKNYWSHNTPDGKTPWAFLSDAGYKYQTAGENLAYGFDSSATTMTAWMNSPEHRANILNADYSQIGFGVARSNNYMGAGPETIVVALYGEPAGAAVGKEVSNPNQLQGVLSDATSAGVSSTTQSVSRVSLMPGQAATILFTLSVIAALGLLWMVTRHAFAWQRVMVRSEAFILRHRMFDILIIGLAMLSFIMTRTAGYIG